MFKKLSEVWKDTINFIGKNFMNIIKIIFYTCKKYIKYDYIFLVTK